MGRRLVAWLGILLYTSSSLLPWMGVGSAPRARTADAAVEGVNAGQKLVALTFDDGPKNSTLTLLDGLAQRGVPATFFLIGEQIPGREGTLRRMAEEGHELGIHSYTHAALTGLNNADFYGEVDRTRTVIQNVVGPVDLLLRPPYGMVDAGVRRRANAPIILWSVDPEDWKDRNTDREVNHVLRQVRDGSIILFHDIYPESVEAALQIVDALHQDGYYFVTVSQLFSLRDRPLESGQTYCHAYP